jgi:hypothetical protein
MREDYAMRDVVFEEGQLDRIGVVCPDCDTESVFDLNRDQVSHDNKACPGCGKYDFLECFIFDANRRQDNWVTKYKRLKDTTKNVTVRLYFKPHLES